MTDCIVTTQPVVVGIDHEGSAPFGFEKQEFFALANKHCKTADDIYTLVQFTYGDDKAILDYVLSRTDLDLDWDIVLMDALSRQQLVSVKEFDYNVNLEIVRYFLKHKKIQNKTAMCALVLQLFLEQQTEVDWCDDCTLN